MKRSRSPSKSPIRTKSGIFGRDRDRDRDRSPIHGRRSGTQTSDRMVYLSNLPFETTWMELKDLIREKAGEVNFVEVLQDRIGKSKGCAVVDFKTRDDAMKCVENLHRIELRGRLIVAKEIRDPVAFFRKVKEDTGIDFLGLGDRPGRVASREMVGPPSINENETYGLSPAFLAKLNISTPLERRVFVTNISYNCGVGRLYDIFSLAGKVTWFDLQLDKEGKTKGIAVIEYSHPIEAVQSISMLHNQRLFDRSLSIKMDKFPREGENRRDGELPFGLHSVGMGLGANGAPLTDVASVISSLAPSAPAPAPVFQQNGSAAPLQPAPQYQPPVATSFQPQQQQQPQQNFSSFQPIDSSGYAQAPSLGAAPTGQGGYFNSSSYQSRSPFGGTVSSSTTFQKAAPFSTTTSFPTRVILIKNLPVDYTWQIVSDRVQQFGDLESVEMVSPGVAKIRFMQLKDAERARNALHGTTVEGRTIGTEYL